MGASGALAVASLVVAGTSAAVAANQSSIANKRARNAAAAARKAAGEQTEALAALEQVEKEPEAAIPTADSDAVRRQRRRSISRQLSTRGRQSTILTSPDAGSGSRLGA